MISLRVEIYEMYAGKKIPSLMLLFNDKINKSFTWIKKKEKFLQQIAKS